MKLEDIVIVLLCWYVRYGIDIGLDLEMAAVVVVS